MSLFRISLFTCICQARVTWEDNPLSERPVCQMQLDFLEPESQTWVWLTQPLRFPSWHCPVVNTVRFSGFFFFFYEFLKNKPYSKYGYSEENESLLTQAYSKHLYDTQKHKFLGYRFSRQLKKNRTLGGNRAILWFESYEKFSFCGLGEGGVVAWRSFCTFGWWSR